MIKKFWFTFLFLDDTPFSSHGSFRFFSSRARAMTCQGR